MRYGPPSPLPWTTCAPISDCNGMPLPFVRFGGEFAWPLVFLRRPQNVPVDVQLVAKGKRDVRVVVLDVPRVVEHSVDGPLEISAE